MVVEGNLRWWTHNIINRWSIIELYTWNLYNLINQCHPNKFNKAMNYIGFKCIILWHMIRILNCVPTTQSEIFCHRRFGPLYLSLPCTPLPFSNHHAVVCVYDFLFVFLACSFFAFSFISTYKENHMIYDFFCLTFYLAWYSQDPSMSQMATFHIYVPHLYSIIHQRTLLLFLCFGHHE